MANNLELKLILKAFDGMSDVVKSACTQSDDAFSKMNKSLEATAVKFDAVGKKSAVFGGALVAASALNAKTAGDFEAQMNNVSTLIDTNKESLKAMGDEVLKIGKNSPKAFSDLADGLYSIRSAGISAADQFSVLKGSQMLSVAGLSTTAEAVDIATSAINAFNLKGEEQNRIYDMFFKVVKYGKTNISEFAQGFGSVAGVVSSAGIKLDEYSASVAALTTSGLKANIAHTQMKAAIAGLSRGSKEQMVIFQQLGAKNFPDLIQKSGGVVNAFNKIYNGVSGNQSKLIQLVGSIEGYNAILSLTGANNKTYLQALNDMRNSGNSLAEAYAKQTDGLNNQMAIIGNQIQALSIRFGNGLLPVIKAMGVGISNLTNAFDKMPDGLVNFISITTAGVGALALFGGTGLMVAGSIIRNIIAIRKALRTFSIVSWANPALIPVVAVTAGIAALGAAGVYCYNKFEGFRNMCQGTWAVIKAGGAWLAVLGNSFVQGTAKVWNFISPAVKFGLTIASWLHPIGLVYHAISGLVYVIGSLVQKAGGLRAIGTKIKNWADSSSANASDINKAVKNQKTVVDGSHANGLDYVPYDNYIAQTHKGEAILTKEEADEWRRIASARGVSGQLSPKHYDGVAGARGTSTLQTNIQNKAHYNTNNTSNSPSDITVYFNPVINIPKNAPSDIKELIMQVLKQCKSELLDELLALIKRREVRSY